MKKVKLTNKMLRDLISEEAAKFGSEQDVEDTASDTEEVDADEFADSLEKKIDHVKALKIEENRLKRRLQTIQRKKQKFLRTL